jgi:Polysaccharide lyase
MALRLTLICVVSSIAFTSCRNEKATPVAPTSSGAVPPLPGVLWSADHETGDLSQWYAEGGGGEFNSGSASSTASSDVAHSGRYSARTSILTPGVSGVRLFRWNESRIHPEAYYSAWFYFPRSYRVPVWWNIFQFKSRSGAAVNDPFWSLQVGNRRNGAMHLYLDWWNRLSIEGPRRGEFGGRSFSQDLKDLSVENWIHIEVFLRQSSAFDGQLIVWQDGVELFNVRDIRTRYPAPDGANEWSISNYSDAIVPSPTTIYIDDAVISTTRTR